MKSVSLFAVLALIIFSCRSRSAEVEAFNIAVNEHSTDSTLTQILDFPVIDDSAKFIADLIRVYDLNLEDNIIGEKKKPLVVTKK